jgi:hypothetical protein
MVRAVQMITIKPHAELRMKDRGITKAQIYKVLRNPREVISVRYGRLAAYGDIKEKRLVVIYEKKNEDIEVITTLWVDERRLRRFGFTRI